MRRTKYTEIFLAPTVRLKQDTHLWALSIYLPLLFRGLSMERQVGLELEILLLPSVECWDQRCIPPQPVRTCIWKGPIHGPLLERQTEHSGATKASW